MKKIILAMALASVASAASAASTLTSATVTGPTGTVWNTNNADGYYALFLQNPFGNTLNPNDNFAGFASAEGSNDFVIAGDGYYPGTNVNSDPFYTLTLGFADGASISGVYSFVGFPGGQFVEGPNSSATVGNTTYTLTGFGWDRSKANNVSQYAAVRGGDPFDYTGQFSFTAMSGAVPEPATWALFILGFGMVGGAMRARSAKAAAARTRMNFA